VPHAAKLKIFIALVQGRQCFILALNKVTRDYNDKEFREVFTSATFKIVYVVLFRKFLICQREIKVLYLHRSGQLIFSLYNKVSVAPWLHPHH
jgi:hypothetical protein